MFSNQNLYLFLFTGTVSWIHYILCSISIDDWWFKRYMMLLAFLTFIHVCYLFILKHVFLFFHWAAIYRWQQAMPPKMAMLRSVMVFINFLYTVLVLNYSSVGFMVYITSSLCYFFAHLVNHCFSKSLFCCFVMNDDVQVLSLHETLVAYKSVYFIGTVVPIVVILLSYLVPVKPVRPKTRKEE